MSSRNRGLSHTGLRRFKKFCNPTAGAHFDVYVVDYTHFRPGSQDSSIFAPPKVCKNVEPQPPPISLRSFPARMRALAPAVRHGELLACRPSQKSPVLSSFVRAERPSKTALAGVSADFMGVRVCAHKALQLVSGIEKATGTVCG